MPPAKPRRSTPKKHVLTLAQLASYDDILTDALVDHAFYWTTIPKNRPSYLPSRGVKEDEITKIIQKHLIVEPDMPLAEEKLLATNGLSKFYRALKTDQEKEDFRRHMRRYMHIYLPDCPFEVTTTNRYTIFQEEASISARRFIKSHETIKYLSGIQVVITPEEEAELSERKKDFSIVVSSRKKEANLFMGPARFANHDCDANARLVTTGQAGIEIIATKPISLGEEITVTYSDSYFGEDNCECLCKTCEDHLVNGWAPADGSVPVKQSVEDDTSTPVRGYSLRRRDDFNRGLSETPSLTPIARPKVRKTRLRYHERTAESTPTLETSRKRDADSLATPPVTPAKRQKTAAAAAGSSRSISSRASSVVDHAVATPDDNDNVDLIICSPRPTSIAQSIQVLHGDDHLDDGRAHDQAPTPEASQQLSESDSECDPIQTVNTPAGDEMSQPNEPAAALLTPELSASADSEQGDCLETVTREAALDADSSLLTPRQDKVMRDEEEADATSHDDDNKGAEAHSEDSKQDQDDESSTGSRHRVPGDYTLTPLLLSEPETAWVICTVCSKAFVQHDAYFTRTSCPRCERHSKLHGYLWPKTEPEGKGDKEERILDHRLIHRFLDPEDEAKIRGRKPLSWRSESTADGERPSKRKSSGTGLGSGIWRKLKYTTTQEESSGKSKAAKAAKAAKMTKTEKEKAVPVAKVTKATKVTKTTKTAVGTAKRAAKATMAAAAAKKVMAAEASSGVRRSGRPRKASAKAARVRS